MSRLRVAKIRESWGAQPHERVVLAPARLAPARGQRTLIEAAALISAVGLPDVRFVLAGEAAKAAFGRELDAYAVAQGVKDRRSPASAPRPTGRPPSSPPVSSSFRRAKPKA